MRALAAILLLGSGTLGLVWAQNADYRPDDRWQAPREAASRGNPLPATAEIVGGGRKLFLRHCAECHGDDGQGRRRAAADLQLPIVQQQSDGTLFWKISNGNPRRGMPSWGRLPEGQRWQLVLYLRALRPNPASGGTAK
jgi:mono/diheme cytochrome c family protein